MPSDTLTTAEAAALLNVNASRVRQLILSGRLPAEKHGRDWAIKREDAEALRGQGIIRPYRKKGDDDGQET
jgi:excisionase family DNA binding protein